MIKICEHCQSEFKIKPSHAARRKYCSISCKNMARKSRTVVSCAHCQTLFEVTTSRLVHGRGVHCSTSCQYAAIRARESKALVYNNCLACGASFPRYHSQLKMEGSGKYCSRSCRDTHRVGPDHPQYVANAASSKRGPNWQSQKRKTKSRDGHSCQECGIIEGVLHVHHIMPYRWFTDYRIANNLANLVTLCSACHRKADAILQRLDRDNRGPL